MVEKKRNLYNILIVAFVALGSFAFGYSNTIIETTLAQPSFMYVHMVRVFFVSICLTPNHCRSYFALDKRPNSNAISGATSGLYTGGGRQ